MCPPATEMLRQRARKKFMHFNFNGPLSSRCRVPGAPRPGLGSGRFGLVWAVICRQYLVYWPCLAMGAQIKADACWLLISRSCFTLIFCSKLVWVSGSEPFRPWVHGKSLCWKKICMFFRPYTHYVKHGKIHARNVWQRNSTRNKQVDCSRKGIVKYWQ